MTAASWASSARVDSIVSRRENDSESRRSLPASILDTSRMSSMIVSSVSAEPRTWSAKSRWRVSSGVSSSSSVIPITPFMGVRISWLMLARNADFRSEAASASSRA